ncbi:MAG: xanthine dehydrogenase accessory protein XdhC [Bacteroidales bacterium]|nr:xanthine dehydrogenase accessory protein XdhC [Bacteroidales bacterium]
MKDILLEAAELIRLNKPAAMCTVVETKGSSPRKSGTRMIVLLDKTIIGTIGGGSVEYETIKRAIDVIKTGQPILYDYNLKDDLQMECGGDMQVYIEALANKPNLYIFGAGHVGKALSNLAVKFDFQITIIDERDNIFDDYDINLLNVFNGDFVEFINTADFNDKTFVTIMTHEHKHDFEVLSKVCKKPYKYLGMIGSKTKVRQAKNQLLEKKILSEDKINKIDMPIGIRIKCETPEEIAVSIVAKLIDVKNDI